MNSGFEVEVESRKRELRISPNRIGEANQCKNYMTLKTMVRSKCVTVGLVDFGRARLMPEMLHQVAAMSMKCWAQAGLIRVPPISRRCLLC